MSQPNFGEKLANTSSKIGPVTWVNSRESAARLRTDSTMLRSNKLGI